MSNSDISPRLRFFEGQPVIKNSHLITHILVHNNEQILLFSDKAIYVYSYQQMVRDEAALVNVIEYQKLFKLAAEEGEGRGKGRQKKGENVQQHHHHMDEITRIFNHPLCSTPSRSFGDSIFSTPTDINTNILLQPFHFINRLTYLNSIRIQSCDISSSGDLLINFVNGQSYLVRRDNQLPYYKSYQVVDLGLIVKGKIEQARFVYGVNHLVIVYSDDKLIVIDCLRNVQMSSHKCTSIDTLNSLYGFTVNEQEDRLHQHLHSQRIVIVFQHPHKLLFYEYNIQRKKLTHIDTLQLKQHFIENIFVYPRHNVIYISTASKIIKFEINQLGINSQKYYLNFKIPSCIGRSKSKESQKSSKSLQKNQTLRYQIVCEFLTGQPQQMLYINSIGDFIPKCKNTIKQYLNLVAQTTSGILVGVTCKKAGNYKEGQVLIGFQNDYFTEIIRNCCMRIKTLNKYESLNFQDLSIFAQNPKLKKQIVPKLSKLFNQSFNKFSEQHEAILHEKLSTIQIEEIHLNQDQFEVLFLNLGYLFQSKELARQKIIQKRLIRQMRKKTKQEFKSIENFNIKNIKERCIFTFQEIGEEGRILQCKKCDLYGIQQTTQNPNIWEFGLRNGFNRCPVCLNEMKHVD